MLWAVRDAAGVVIDFETGYANPAMDRMLGVAAEQEGGFWLFSVADNRIGIPPELGDDAFAMFKRAHGEDCDGCGIDLAVCRKLVEAHGGAITAAPLPGGGTTVRFTCPRSLRGCPTQCHRGGRRRLARGAARLLSPPARSG